MVKPASSVNRILAGTAAAAAASRVCRETFPTTFAGLLRIMSSPAALRVTAQKFPPLILILAVWVMGPSEVRLTVPEEPIPSAVTPAIVVLSLVPLV